MQIAPLSVLIVGSAFFIIRVLHPGLIAPALGVLFFSYAAIATMVAALIHADRNSKSILGYCRRIHPDGLHSGDS